MTKSLCIIVGLLTFSLIVVSANEQFFQVLKRSVSNIHKKLTQTQINDLNYFKNIVLKGLQDPQSNVNSIEDPAIPLLDESKTSSFPMAIIKYMQRKLGFQYPLEIAMKNNRSRLSDDYIRFILQPCKAVIDTWSASKSLFLLKKYPKELVELAETEKEMYNALITGQVCFYLLELTDSVFERSFKFLIEQKARSGTWFASMFKRKVESESNGRR